MAVVSPARRFCVAHAAPLIVLLAATPAAPESPLTAHDVGRIRSVGEVAVAPEGDRIAYLLTVPRDPFEQEDGPAWSELHLADRDGGSRPYVSGEETVSAIAWRPGHREITFLAKRPGDETKALWGIAVDGGEARRLLSHATDLSGYAWSPDGKRVAFLAEEAESAEREELEAKGFDAEVFEERLRPARVWVAPLDAEGDAPRALELPGSASELHWAPSGTRLAVALAPTPLVDDRYMKRRVHVVDADSGEIVGAVDHAAKLGAVAWSPDGTRLAMIAGEDLHDPKEGRLFVVDASGGVPRELLPGYVGHVAAFAWRSATEIVYVGDEGVWTVLGSVAADGSPGSLRLPGPGPIWRELSIPVGGDVAALAGDTPSHPRELFLLPLDGGEARRLTHSNAWLDDRRLAPQTPVTYRARDGLELEGLLVRPPGEAPLPLVLMIHGGPEAHYRNGWLTSYSRPAQVLAARGIASFYPNYRGSTGRGVAFSRASQGDPAGAEFDDLVDAVDHLVEAGVADRDRVGITGGSYGGYATAWAATRFTERFAAGVMFVGISNEISKVGTSDIPNELNLVHLRHWPWERWELALERSPIYHGAAARTPLLILHGKKDSRVFPGQSMELYRLLKTVGRTPVRLVLYPQEGHGNRRAAGRLDYSLRLLRWMEHYLLGPGGDPPPPDLEYHDPATEPAADEGEGTP